MELGIRSTLQQEAAPTQGDAVNEGATNSSLGEEGGEGGIKVLTPTQSESVVALGVLTTNKIPGHGDCGKYAQLHPYTTA
jgi:hypothetical protein